jgi:hypothetical protein
LESRGEELSPSTDQSLQQDYVEGHIVALGRGGVSYERSTPVGVTPQYCSVPVSTSAATIAGLPAPSAGVPRS